MAPDPTSPVPPANGAGAPIVDAIVKLGESETLQRLSEKPGVKTTEFWLSVVASLLGGYLALSGKSEVAGAALAAIATVSYNLSRGIVKKAAAVGALLFALGLAGCSPAGYVKADAIQGLVHRVCARHDAYVSADGSLDADQKGTALDSSSILMKAIDEAVAAASSAR